MRVGEKETSEQAEIVRRYADLFSRASSRRCARPRRARAATSASGSSGCGRRARAACSRTSSSSATTSSRTSCWRRASRSRARRCRSARRRRSSRCCPSTQDREELGDIQAEASAAFNPDRLDLLSAGEELEAELSGIAGPVERNEDEKGISLRELSAVLEDTSRRLTDAFVPLRDRWFDRLLGPGRPEVPTSSHMSYMRRLSPLESTYTKERATEVCLATLKELGFDLAAATNIKLDLDDRPQKAPRACVIASDPPSVVHLITRAQGGLHDYQAFLHEAGHALHYGGVDPSLPIAFRRLARDHALTEIYSYIVEAISQRARVACAPLRPLRRAGRRERRGDRLPRGDPLPPLRGEAPLRARLLGPLQRGRRHPRRLRGVPHRRDRRPLPPLRLPRRHGSRLLLGRLPARVGAQGAAPPAT